MSLRDGGRTAHWPLGGTRQNHIPQTRSLTRQKLVCAGLWRLAALLLPHPKSPPWWALTSWISGLPAPAQPQQMHPVNFREIFCYIRSGRNYVTSGDLFWSSASDQPCRLPHPLQLLLFDGVHAKAASTREAFLIHRSLYFTQLRHGWGGKWWVAGGHSELHPGGTLNATSTAI